MFEKRAKNVVQTSRENNSGVEGICREMRACDSRSENQCICFSSQTNAYLRQVLRLWTSVFSFSVFIP